jgi:uncharacterized protein (TIGR03435 family)
MPKQFATRILCIALTVIGASAQTPAAGPVFDVASIKSAGPLQAQVAAGKLHIGMSIDAARVDIGSMSLADLIPIAFGVKPYQVSGPDWMKETRFDILAKMPEGATKEQVPLMLQALLVERFKLVVRRETKDHPIYALVVGKNGSKLKDSAPDADAPPPEASAQSKNGGMPVFSTPEGQVRVANDGKGAVVSGGPMGTTRISMGPSGTMHLEAAKMSMPALAEMLGRFVDKPVIDMTELKGTYQVGIDLSMIDMMNAARTAGLGVPPPGAGPGGGDGRGPGGGGPGGGGPGAAIAASEPTGGTIFEAVQQLGLKMDPRKSAIETIVVERVEKLPTEN